MWDRCQCSCEVEHFLSFSTDSLDLKMKNLQKTFLALLSEAGFTKEMLGTGATQIRKANYSSQGIYAQAFSNLSIGIERVGKLCLLLDYYIDNDGRFPDFNYLKNSIGHKLELLHNRSAEIAAQKQIKFKFLSQLNHPVHLSILRVLHLYAEGDRYSNINILVSARQQNDPIASWFNNVDNYIFENIISKKTKEKIIRNAKTCKAMMPNSSVFFISETGEEISDYEDASCRTGMFEVVAPYRQLFILQIIRYWVELLSELSSIAQRQGRQDIPYLSEVFGGFYNSDTYFKTRRTWNI